MVKRILLLFFCLVLGISSLFATATVKEFFGKVKVKFDGDTSWSKIEVGMELPGNSMVSTGFNSQIILDLGNATLDVLPLTRMTIEEISESQDTIKTSLFLQGGKITADVGKIEGKVNDFVIKSPVATASVRGTKFNFTGNSLDVIRGEVAFAPTKKKKEKSDSATEEEDEEEEDAEEEAGVSVKAGGKTQMSAPGARPVAPSAMAAKKSSVPASTKPAIVRKPARVSIDGPAAPSDVPSVTDVQAFAETTTNVTIEISIQED